MEWLEKYLQILQERPEMSEVGWRVELLRWIIIEGLSYHNNYDFDKNRADLRIRDNNGISYIVIETKLKEDEIYAHKTFKQALSYCEGSEAFIILASKKRWLVYDLKGSKKGDIIFTENGVIDENGKPSGLFESLHSNFVEKRFDDFKEGKISSGIVKLNAEGFEKLNHALKRCHNMLLAYASIVWPRLQEKYRIYRFERDKLEKDRELVEHNETHIILQKEKLIAIEQATRKLEKEFEVEIEAVEKSYELFKKVQPYSRDVNEKEALEIYLTEVCYLALNRALMIRILEDKGLLNHKISGDGINRWRDFTAQIKDEYQFLLRFSFWDAEKIYSHFFQEGIYDWFLKTNKEIGDVLLKVFYLLNSFDFSDIDRDLLKELYQKYYDPAERKKLGEFYTPPEVIHYLLKAVGWPVEGKLLDFSCGSGGFLVEALKMKLINAEKRHISALNQWRETENIFGFDINPFAAHIAEMNLLFLLIDKFKNAMEELEKQGEAATLPDLNVFAIDALLNDKYSQGKFRSDWRGERWGEAHIARDYLNYRFLVGNPPYIRNERLPDKEKKFYDEIFADYKEGNTDIFAYFLKKGMDWLEEGGKMGLIVSQGLADAKATEKVRRFLEEYTIEELVPLEWANVFKFSSVNPFLIVVKKEKPSKKHKIRIHQCARSLKGLGEKDYKTTQVKQSDWQNLAPDHSWRMEISADDIPILNKLNKYPKPFEGHYGMVLRSKEILISDNPKDMKNPVRILDGREIKAWSIDWQGRYLDYDKEKISDPKSEGFFKNTKIILPYISLASQAVKYENDFYFRHSIMSIICNINISLDIQCALINNIVNRYYYTLILRSSTLQGSKRSQFHPRIINNFIIQKNVENNPQILSRLEELSRDCHALAHDMAHGDRELSAWIEDKVSRKFRYFSTYSDTDLSTLSGVLNIEKAFFDKNGRLIEEGSLFHIGGNKNRLYYILQKSALEGKEKLTKKELEDFKIPEDPAVLKEINLKIADWLQRKPTLGEKLRANEREIDRLVLEACSDLTDKERETIIRRCREFPLSEVIQTPLPGKPTKKIKVKVYSDRFK